MEELIRDLESKKRLAEQRARGAAGERLCHYYDRRAAALGEAISIVREF